MKNLTLGIILIISLLVLASCSDSNHQQVDTIQSEKELIPESKEKATNYQALVDKDTVTFQDYFTVLFPDVEFSEFKNGVYAIDQAAREQWIEIEDFPPYEMTVDEGEELFKTTFGNGKSYQSCFNDIDEGVRQNFPYYDDSQEQVITLELAINQCRERNDEAALKYGSGEIASLSAFIAFKSRDKKFNIKVSSEGAYQSYLAGKKFYYSKRGQLNFACADCHIKISGMKLRADTLSPGLGHPTGMPVHRSKWGELGTIGLRYQECNKNVRAEPFELQSTVYRDLEFFQTIMSNGLEVNGPSSRK